MPMARSSCSGVIASRARPSALPRVGWFRYLFALLVLTFICSLFYIWSRMQIVNIGYEINHEMKNKERLIEENKRLSLELATLKSPVRLEALAKSDYQMDLPRQSQILRDGAFPDKAPVPAATPALLVQTPKQDKKVEKKASAKVAKTEGIKTEKKPVPLAQKSSAKKLPVVASAVSPKSGALEKNKLAAEKKSVKSPVSVIKKKPAPEASLIPPGAKKSNRVALSSHVAH